MAKAIINKSKPKPRQKNAAFQAAMYSARKRRKTLQGQQSP
jgi:hypothetical protein